MYKFYILILCCLVATGGTLPAQSPAPTTAKARLEGYKRRQAISSPHILQNLEFKSIGPTIMGGRVIDLEVNPEDPSEFYVAYASGGLWHTVNNGQTYEPLFDHEMVMSIGDIAVNWADRKIWIGSGENNSSRSSYSGFGIYMSADSGRTWKNMGLTESHHIGRIVLHPVDPDRIWVAAMGHLYGPNEERGVYMSEDGGQHWEKVLYRDDQTGAIDLVVKPGDADVLYAALWQRSRKAWDFQEAGPGTGIYRSADGGRTWKPYSGEGSGFAHGDLGRIGLAFSSDGSLLYALLDNQNRRSEEDKKKEGLTKEDLRSMTSAEFAAVSDRDLKKYLEINNFPTELSADSIRNLIAKGLAEPHHLVDFIEDANRDLFDTEVVGAEVYRCKDGIREWRRTHEDFIDDLVYSYGYYFGQIRVSPERSDILYITGVPIVRSEDGGKTFASVNSDNQHVDHHALWIDPKKPEHMMNGNDGGLNETYDGGKHWSKLNSPAVGQFYTVSVDRAKPYHVYGGLQDNGVWMGPSTYVEGTSWQSVGRYPYQRIMGGDGFQVEVDDRDNKTVYTGYQFGHYYRFNSDGGKRTSVTPGHKFGERPLRFNWQTPIYLSRHNQDIFYIGSNKFHRSLNKGDSYDLVSTDLTKGGRKGDVSFGTLTCIEESPLMFGLIYTGSDDGLVYESQDMGYQWQKINEGLPSDMWVSRLEASHHDTNRVYVALNAYRWDDFEAMIYRSDDRGRHWDRIGNDLPLEPVNVILEDDVNENILYVGTDHGLYISLDRGEHFMYMDKSLPAVAVHDLVIQPDEHDLLVGSHGRSIYKADITYVQKLTAEVMDKGIHFFKIPSVKQRDFWGKKMSNWKEIKEENLALPVYVKKGGQYRFLVETAGGTPVRSWEAKLDAGLNLASYDLTIDKDKLKAYQKEMDKKSKDEVEWKEADDGHYYVRAAAYKVSISGQGEKASQKLSVTSKKKNEKN